MKQLAVVKNIHFGNRDIDQPCVWFEAYESIGCASLQVLTGEEMIKAIKDSGVSDFESLEGTACWIERDEKKNISRFVGFFRP